MEKALILLTILCQRISGMAHNIGKEVLSFCLDIDISEIKDDANMYNLIEWDSLSHIKIVLEIEAGRAYSNHQFLKDIFEASVMVNTDYLVLAVRNIYNKQKDYQIIRDWLDTLFITKRIKFELKGILLIGY